MKRHLSPSGDRVLVRLKPTDLYSKGGILLDANQNSADARKHATQEAYIVELGVDAYKGLGSGKPWCKPGDLVLISKYSGEDRHDIEDDQIYRVISDEDVYGVFVGEGVNNG